MPFKRPSTMSIQAFLHEFDKCLFKTKTYSITMSDTILAYQLLKSANLSTHHEGLIKATIPDLQYSIIKDQLKKLFQEPQDRSNKQRTLLKLKEPSWKKNSAIWKPSISTRKTHYSPVPNNSPPCLLIFGFSGSEQFSDPPFYLDSPVY